MSLVNQVLRDLDRRHAAAEELTGLPKDVKPLPLPARGGAAVAPRLVAALVALASVVAGAAYLYLRAVPAAAPAASLPAVAVAPSVASPAPAAPVPQSPAAAPAVPPAPTLAAAPAAPVASAPRKADIAAPASAPVAPRHAMPLKVAPALSAIPAEPAMSEASVQKTASGLGRQEGVAPGIEKSVRATSPRERADAEYRRGLGQTARGRSAEAAADFRAALAEDPSYVAVRQALARLLIDERRLDEAAQVLSEGLQRDERQPALALPLARIQIERGQAAAAAETLARSQPAAGQPEYRAFQGGVAQRLGRHKDAVEHYRAAVAMAPQSGVWWMGLGLALEADGRAAEAREAFAQAAGSGSLSPELSQFVEQKLR